MSEIRLKNLRLLERKYGTQAALASAIGKTPGYVNQLMIRYRNIGEKAARTIEHKLALSPGWLDQLHEESGEVALDVTPVPALESVRNTSPAPDARGHVPLISWVQAGSWSEAMDLYTPEDGEDWLPCPTNHGPRTFALRIEGDSMTAPHGRSYPAGCIIYVDPDQCDGITSGDRVIAKLDRSSDVTFKVFTEDAGRRFLKPLNPQYPIITDPFHIVGKIIGTWFPE